METKGDDLRAKWPNSEAAWEDFGSEKIDKFFERYPRIRDALKECGIQTIGQLLARKPSEIYAIRDIGLYDLNNIVVVLARHGLKLPNETTAAEQKKMEEILLPSEMKMSPIVCLGLSLEIYNALGARSCRTVSGVYCEYYWGRLPEMIGEENAEIVRKSMLEHGYPCKKADNSVSELHDAARMTIAERGALCPRPLRVRECDSLISFFHS